MKKLAIFDLDGTLLNTLSTIAYYTNRALARFGFSEHDEAAYKYFVGDGAKKLIARALDACGCNTEENFNRVYPYYMEQYDKDTTYLTTHFEGIPQTLCKLREAGVQLAIVSNKPNSSVQLVVEQFFEKGLFSYVTGAKEGLPHKPNPYFLNDCMRACGVDKEDVLYAGDSGTDMETGKNAGVLTVGVLWGFRGKDELLKSGADLLAEEPQALLEFCKL